MTWRDVMPILMFSVGVVQALLLYSFRSSIRIAILELKEDLSAKYATKEELALVRRLDRIDDGISSVKSIVERKGALA